MFGILILEVDGGVQITHDLLSGHVQLPIQFLNAFESNYMGHPQLLNINLNEVLLGAYVTLVDAGDIGSQGVLQRLVVSDILLGVVFAE